MKKKSEVREIISVYRNTSPAGRRSIWMGALMGFVLPLALSSLICKLAGDPGVPYLSTLGTILWTVLGLVGLFAWYARKPQYLREHNYLEDR